MSDGFLFEWQRAIRNSDLAPSTRLVALTLSTWMDMHGKGARPGVSRLCRATGLKKRATVTGALRGLEEAGFLRCVYRGGRNVGASVYAAMLGTSGNQDVPLPGHPKFPALGTSADEAGYLRGAPSTQDQPSFLQPRGQLEDPKVVRQQLEASGWVAPRGDA